MITEDEFYILREMAQRCCTTAYRDRIQQSILLRSARDEYEKAAIRRVIMEAREAWRIRGIHLQRRWQTQNAKTPQRGRHHDSWAIRESFVRGGNYHDYMAYSNSVRGGK